MTTRATRPELEATTAPTSAKATGDKAARPRAHGVGQSVKAGVEIGLSDTRWFGNLGPEGKYTINPAISATLGKHEHEIGDPSVVLGDQMLGSHVQLHVENAKTTREAADGGHEQIRFNARYTLKNAATWSTPKMSLNMKAANTAELKGSANAKAPLKIAGVGVEGGADVSAGDTLSGEVGAAVNEFQLGGTNSFFAHTHDVEMVVSSSGFAVANVRRSTGAGDKYTDVYAHRQAFTEQVNEDGTKHTANGQPDQVRMPLLQ